jgi:uncharacterized protein YndB with AHSA1/START domain
LKSTDQTAGWLDPGRKLKEALMEKARTLEVTIPSDREIVLSRFLAAPRSVVFESMTRPELLRRWIGEPKGWWMDRCDLDLRVGGTFCFCWRSGEGEVVTLRGLYREVIPGFGSVNSEVYEPAWYPGEAVVTTRLADEEGGTRLTGTLLYGSREARDEVLGSGFEKGTAAAYVRLERLARKKAGLSDAWFDRLGRRFQGALRRSA